ncbi:MAG: single-stranded DNA-binding protein [Turicibacter sp.]|nr:single-stranded DNA-binding protein [Turicibacter sp.]
MNSCQLLGRLTKDPELRHSQNGGAYSYFTLAVDDGRDKALFIDCVCHKATAENLCKYQGKGSLIAVTGKINVNEWEKDSIKHRKFQINVFSIHYTGKAESKPASNLGKDVDQYFDNLPTYGYANGVGDDGLDLPF